MPPAELDDRLSQLRKELTRIKGVLASGGIPEDIGKVREMRRSVARILTIKREKTKTMEAK